MLQAHKDAGAAQESAAIASATAQAATAAMALIPEDPLKGATQFVTGNHMQPERAWELRQLPRPSRKESINVKAIQAQTSAEVNSILASFERRNDEWQLQEGLAALDVQMGDQQIVLAGNQIDIAEQELAHRRVGANPRDRHSEFPSREDLHRGNVSMDRQRAGGCVSILSARGHRHRARWLNDSSRSSGSSRRRRSSRPTIGV